MKADGKWTRGAKVESPEVKDKKVSSAAATGTRAAQPAEAKTAAPSAMKMEAKSSGKPSSARKAKATPTAEDKAAAPYAAMEMKDDPSAAAPTAVGIAAPRAPSSLLYSQYQTGLRVDDMQSWANQVERSPQSLNLDELLEIMVELGHKASSAEEGTKLKTNASFAFKTISNLAGQKLGTLSYADLTSKLDILCSGDKNIAETCIHASFLTKWCKVAKEKFPQQIMQTYHVVQIYWLN